jgi:hypothetical protein
MSEVTGLGLGVFVDGWQEHLWKTQVQTNATLEEMESQQGVYQAHD